MWGPGTEKTTSLWYHRWVGEGPLYTQISGDVSSSKANWFVSHIIRNGKWYIDDIAHILLDHIKNLILATPCLLIWKLMILLVESLL